MPRLDATCTIVVMDDVLMNNPIPSVPWPFQAQHGGYGSDPYRRCNCKCTANRTEEPKNRPVAVEPAQCQSATPTQHINSMYPIARLNHLGPALNRVPYLDLKPLFPPPPISTPSPSVVEKKSVVPKGKKGSGSPSARKFRCQECGKEYKHLSNLRAHAKVHTAEAKVCSYCGKRFGRNANYLEHLRVHTGESPYSCTYCQRKFKHRHSWKDHLRTHTGERPFHCTVCAKTFNVKHNLTVHMRVHTGERPYSCAVCFKTFRQKSAVNSHMKRVHKQI